MAGRTLILFRRSNGTVANPTPSSGMSMQGLVRRVRQQFHPLFYARKSPLGRFAIHILDRPTWLTVHQVSFKVRGRLLTHGLAFAVIGSQEVNQEALAITCMEHLHLHSFWDVGANIGYYTWLMKTVAPEAEAVLVEPLPANVALIRDTIQRNAFPSTTLISAAASDSAGEGVLNADSMAGATSTLEHAETTFEERHWGVASTPIRISLISIDAIRPHHGPVDFMKIDVEGHEQSVLRGASKTIASDQPVLFIECGHPSHACLDSLASAGYILIDADRLRIASDEPAGNYFCIPARFSSAVDTLLHIAREKAKGSLAA
ncbi:MAG TPA: FkbM family methyltransferase [Edaphobacter sp.]|nr:FkbM family methyltransferase [Edaphobacter sp.]